MLISGVLGGAGHEVVQAVDGAQAVELASAVRPALALLDWQMPYLTGIEVCRRLRADPELDGMAVVILTGHDGKEFKVAAVEAGADDCLVKPFEPDAMLARIDELLAAAA
jgi:two-component system phosphate regulon response regulator PhoB